MIVQDTRTLFSVATCASVLTITMLFTFLYISQHHLSALTCVNIASQYQGNELGEKTLVNTKFFQSKLVNRLLLSSGDNTSREQSTVSIPYTSVDWNYGNRTATLHYTGNNQTSRERVTGHTEQNTEKSSPKVATDVSVKSWKNGVLTETKPSIRQNCSKLSRGDPDELERTQILLRTLSFKISSNYTTCAQILTEFSDNFYVSDVERRFPLAFVLVVHTNARQILRFLKAIYRPHNLYCVHPDPKSKEFSSVFHRLSGCLPNFFVASRVHNVKYTRPSTIFRAQMSCFADLNRPGVRSNWKYVVNLCGRELPLKTNREIVEALIKMNGQSVIKPHPIDQYTLDTCFPRARNLVAENNSSCAVASGAIGDHVSIAAVENCDQFLRENHLRLYKSMTYNAYSRKFVHYFLHDKRALALQDWLLRKCKTPEEHFYAMVSTIPGAPGSNSSWLYADQTPETAVLDPPVVFKTIWYHYKSSPHRVKGERCAGRVVHSICILNVAELPRVHHAMTSSNAWFFNKYFMEEDHVVMDCVEEVLVRKNREEYEEDVRLHFAK